MKKMSIPAHFNDVEEKPVTMEGSRNCTIRWLLHKDNGAENFAMRLVTLYKEGIIPLHTHDFEHEIFCVEGEGHVLYGDQKHPMKPGSFVLVPKGVVHGFSNSKEETLRVICLIPGSRKPE